MKKLRLVRGSEVGTFLQDRWSWKRRWVDHLVKKTPDGKLFFGTLFHKHMEHRYENPGYEMVAHDMTNEWLQKEDLSGMDQVQYQELIELFHEVVAHYENYYQHEYEGMQTIATELKFAIPLFEEDPLNVLDGTLDFAYEGTIDLVYLQDGKLKFMDHKTVSSVDRYVKNSILDRQISRYWWALSALCQGYGYVWVENLNVDIQALTDQPKGRWVPVTSTLLYSTLRQFNGPDEFSYNIIRKDAPHAPKLIKKGAALSVDKSQNTTYELYKKAIADNGFSETDYLDILQHFEEQEDKFLRRIAITRTMGECEAAMNDFAKVCKEIMSIRHELEVDPQTAEDTRLYYNITWDTPTFNSYFPLIQAEIMGENVDMVKALLYETEKDWNPEDDYIEVEG